MTRKYVRKIHLWLGLLSGLVLSIVGITGSLYVFEPELSTLMSRETYLVEGEKAIFSGDPAIAAFIEAGTGSRIESLQWPNRGRQTYLFKLFDDEHWYFFDQTTGEITTKGKHFGNPVFAVLLDVHTTLTLGETGRLITGTASLLFALFMLSTGIYLWWPHKRGRRRSSFTIKWNARTKRLNYDLHNVTGFYFFLPLFIMGITGAYFFFPDSIQWAVDKITFSRPAPPSVWDEHYSDTTLQIAPLTVVEALHKMDEHYPGYHKRNLWMSGDEDGTLSFAYQAHRTIRPGPDRRIFLTADRYTGEILATRDADKLPRGAALSTKWLLPLHFGEFGGWPTRVLWFIAGFIPALLTWTGVRIWWWRARKSKPIRYFAKTVQEAT